MTPNEFLNKYADTAIICCEGTAIFPSVMLAQAAIESGWGKYVAGNNFFGIKAHKQSSPYWNGDTVTSRTSEYENGNYVSTSSQFRKYSTVGNSFKDYIYFLYHNGVYSNVLKANTPEEQAKAIKSAGYATDPNYADKIISIINKYNLKRFDQKKKS